MLAVAAPAVLAVLIGLACGGSLTKWDGLRLRWWILGAASLSVQLVLFNPPLDEQPWAIVLGPLLFVLTLIGIALVLVRNAAAMPLARTPLRIAALGVGLNLLVICANGGYMPRSAEASATVGRPVDTIDDGQRLANVHVLSDSTRLPWLGDVLPEPEWLPLTNVLSVGDILLAAGVAWWAFRLTTSTADSLGLARVRRRRVR
jgi:hypothetical protein